MKNILTCLLLILILTNCIGGGIFLYKKYFSDYHTEKKNIENVTIALKWVHQAQFAGLYYADKEGYFEDEGIEANFIPYNFEDSPIDLVLSGKAQFGVAGADELLMARAEGKPVKALAVIYQKNPVVAFSLEESGIKKPSDFIGKKVGIETSQNIEFIIRAMLGVEGVDYDKDVLEVPIGFDPAPLITGEVDVATGYLTNEPIILEEQGYRVNIINPSDYGVNVYSDVLFTSEDLILLDEGLVNDFVKATLDGWDSAYQNKEKAISYTLAYRDDSNPGMNYKHEMALFEKSLPLIKPTIGTQIGDMSFAEWKKTHDLLRRYGILQKDVNLNDTYTKVFIK